ncbi:MAG: hypothetical protein QXD70_01020 [Candidatus Bathyarchaeia archaeon]
MSKKKNREKKEINITSAGNPVSPQQTTASSPSKTNASLESPIKKYRKEYRRSCYNCYELEAELNKCQREYKELKEKLKNYSITARIDETPEEAHQRFNKEKEQLIREYNELKWKILGLHGAIAHKKRQAYFAQRRGRD